MGGHQAHRDSHPEHNVDLLPIVGKAANSNMTITVMLSCAAATHLENAVELGFSVISESEHLQALEDLLKRLQGLQPLPLLLLPPSASCTQSLLLSGMILALKSFQQLAKISLKIVQINFHKLLLTFSIPIICARLHFYFKIHFHC